MERERREDRGLRRGVVPLDVGRRVGLRVPEGLRLLEGLLEVQPVRRHLVEHVVGGAVDDAEHAAHLVAGERLPHRADDRDRARHGGLERQVDARGVRGLEQLRAVRGEQRLVRGDDARAGSDRAVDEPARRLDAAHELDDEVGPVDERLGVLGEQVGRDHRADAVARSARVAHGDAHQVEARPGPGGEVVRVLDQRLRDLGADHPAAEQRDAQHRGGRVGRLAGTGRGDGPSQGPGRGGCRHGRTFGTGCRDGVRIAAARRPPGRRPRASAQVEREQVVDRLAPHQDARRAA